MFLWPTGTIERVTFPVFGGTEILEKRVVYNAYEFFIEGNLFNYDVGCCAGGNSCYDAQRPRSRCNGDIADADVL